MSGTVVGLASYRKEDYGEILRIMADADQLPDTHEDWRKKADEVERELLHHGTQVVRVPLDPKAFLAWCTLRGLRLDAQARSRYASEEAPRMVEGKG